MRFSTAAFLALGPLAAVAESPFAQYKAKFQNMLSALSGSAGLPQAADNVQVPIGNAKPKTKVVEPKKIDTLTLANWKDTFYVPVHAEATVPEEWLVLVTGGNKTCFGHCGQLDKAFTDSALTFGALSKPQLHLASVNCDDEPVLCNSWSASTGVVWLFEVLPPPAQTGLYVKRLNTTTVTSQDIVDAYTGDREEWRKVESDSYFHPIDGFFAKNGLAVPLGWFFWGLNAVPSWVMMLVISFASRSMMNKRMDGMAGGPRPRAPGAAAPRGAAPGDARS